MTTKPNETKSLAPYLYFDGRAEEAIEFYHKALGAEVLALFRFKDSPDPGMSPPGSGDKVMHASLGIGGTILFVSDGRCGGNAKFEGFSLSLTAGDTAEAERLFAALTKDGQVQMPMTKTFFSPSFGMVTDKFGVPWMIYVRTA